MHALFNFIIVQQLRTFVEAPFCRFGLWAVVLTNDIMSVYNRLREAEPPSRGAFPLFGSRFRYSGRTQYQTRNAASTISRQAPSIDRASRRGPRGPTGTLEGSRSGTLDRPGSRSGTLDRGS